MEQGTPNGSFWKTRLGVTSIIVGGAALVGAVGYAMSASKSSSASGSTSSSGASQNPPGPYPTSQAYPVSPGTWYLFDIGSSSHWTDANWSVTGGPALVQAIIAAGFVNPVVQPDPSDPSASTYLVAAQWPSAATETQVFDNPPAWYIKPATMRAVSGTPALPTTYAVPTGNWFTFTVWTGLPPNDPNFVSYVKELLSAAGWGTITNGQIDSILVTQSASNPEDANVAALWAQGAPASFTDGAPLWGLLAAPVDTGSTSQPPQPGA